MRRGYVGREARPVEEALAWPRSEQELIAVQAALAQAAEAALATRPWALPETAPLIAGCCVAYATGEAGPGHPGDGAWAAAVLWRPVEPAVVARSADRVLRRRGGQGGPRQAADVVAQAVVGGRAPASYTPGLLALREGPILADAVGALDVRPDVLLVDATGLDHPRRAGLAIHLGRIADLPTVGVTSRPLVARGAEPALVRGASTPLFDGDRVVARWLCTRTGARPIVAHAGWRTDPDVAAAVALVASTEGARTPVPLQEARRVAREMRAIAEH